MEFGPLDPAEVAEMHDRGRPGPLHRMTQQINDLGVRRHAAEMPYSVGLETRIARADFAVRNTEWTIIKRLIPVVGARAETIAKGPPDLIPARASGGEPRNGVAQMRSGGAQTRCSPGQARAQRALRAIEIMDFLDRWQPDLGMLREVVMQPCRSSLLRANAKKVWVHTSNRTAVSTAIPFQRLRV